MDLIHTVQPLTIGIISNEKVKKVLGILCVILCVILFNVIQQKVVILLLKLV